MGNYDTMYGRVRIPHSLLGRLPGTVAVEPPQSPASTASRCLSREGRERSLEDVGRRTPLGPVPMTDSLFYLNDEMERIRYVFAAPEIGFRRKTSTARSASRRRHGQDHVTAPSWLHSPQVVVPEQQLFVVTVAAGAARARDGPEAPRGAAGDARGVPRQQAGLGPRAGTDPAGSGRFDGTRRGTRPASSCDAR